MLTIKHLSLKEEGQPAAISELKPLPITEVTPETLTTLSSRTLKYMASGRYVFGWSDPRVLYGASSSPMCSFSDYAKTIHNDHYAHSMTDEQIRSAWLLLFGSDPISFTAIGARNDDDDWRIAYEAYSRGLLHEDSNFNTYSYTYTLKK